jgi:shikimate kinase
VNVYLLGHRGVGKSTVAPLAAELLGRRWLDLDAEIERLESQSISQLFADRGEAWFRDRETIALQLVANEKDLVVATGGGLVGRELNRSLLSMGYCVWLRASPGTIVRRLRDSGTRPPLTDLRLEEETAALLQIREPLYQGLSNAVVDVDDVDAVEVARRVAHIVRAAKNDPPR